MLTESTAVPPTRALVGLKMLCLRVATFLSQRFILRRPNWRHYALLDQPFARTTVCIPHQRLIDLGMRYVPESATEILDCGCSDGYGVMKASELLGRPVKLTGLTVNLHEWYRARRRGLNVRYGDMHSMPFANGTFDCVFSKDNFEHSIAPYIVMCEFNRVLRLGGHTVIVIPEEKWVECSYHFAVVTPLQMKEMLHKCGFELLRSDDFSIDQFDEHGGVSETVYVARKIAEHDPRKPRPSKYE